MIERARRVFPSAKSHAGIRNGIRSVLIAQMLLSLTAPAFAQEDDSSLDALWNANPDASKQSKTSSPSTSTTKPKNSGSIDTSPNFKVTTGGASDSGSSKPAVDFNSTAESAESPAPTSSSGSAPLCSIDTFKSSDFIKLGGWPGVGPFNTARNTNEMKDAADNHLMLKVENQKVTEADLCLVKQPNPSSNFINLEMTTDYFLEALGVKPGKISDFNKELEKSKTEVVKEGARPLSLPAGKYLVNIQAPTEDDLSPLPQDKREKIALVIKVSNRDASSSSIRDTASTAVDTTPDEVVEQPPVKVATATPSTRPTTPAVKPPVKVPVTQPPAVKTTPPAATTAATGPDALKNQFIELLKNWQTVKKTAVRNRSTGELADVLSGEALKKQTGAIKYLMSQHKYYEMTSKGVTVNKIQDLVPGKKYACYALVKEYRRFIDDTTGQVLKEGEDTYNVNYTIEKIDDKYFISDSAVINAPPAKSR